MLSIYVEWKCYPFHGSQSNHRVVRSRLAWRCWEPQSTVSDSSRAVLNASRYYRRILSSDYVQDQSINNRLTHSNLLSLRIPRITIMDAKWVKLVDRDWLRFRDPRLTVHVNNNQMFRFLFVFFPHFACSQSPPRTLQCYLRMSFISLSTQPIDSIIHISLYVVKAGSHIALCTMLTMFSAVCNVQYLSA